VNCTTDSGALASALASASDGDALSIQGTCKGTFEIAHSITLAGTSGATLDGQGAGTVVTIDDGMTVVISGVTISGGSAGVGGGIYTGFGTTLTLTNSTITGNHASSAGGGLFSHGTLTLNNSSVKGNSGGFGGAGIYNNQAATLVVVRSIISGNTTDISGGNASNGGGIYNDSGTVTIDNSTIAENTVFNGGAGLYNVGAMTLRTSTVSGNTGLHCCGGGIANVSSMLTIENSTIADNTATPGGGGGGGGIFDISGGRLVLRSSTVADNTADPGNGGGILNLFDASESVSNTIIAGNSGGGCIFAAGDVSALSDGGYNLEDGTSCGFSAANNSLSNTNPMLDPSGLKDNGGPTKTIALESGSPAIDAIPPTLNGCGTTITTDQRGVTRPQGSGCDLGAYEATQATPAQLLAALGTAVIGVGPGTSLSDKVAQALAYLNSGDVSDTCSTLTAFINELRAQSGKTIPQVQAATLIASAQQIKTLLGC
jgi:hypothetical protein